MVWVGLVGNGAIIGPFFFEQNITGQAYLDMIDQHVIPTIVGEFGIAFDWPHYVNGMFPDMWWFQDGAPAHRLGLVTERLHILFRERVVSLNEAIEWPPRSPDLTPLDFFLWRYLKSKVFSIPPPNLDAMKRRIRVEIDVLKQNRAMIRNIMQGMERRAIKCIEREGAQVEGVF